jgi:MerR family transcriptional regulator/heat shock protein HspR
MESNRKVIVDGEISLQHSAITQTTYVISVAAERAGVHPQTLRIYERKGLLDPNRTPGGSRRYSDEDIAQMRRIQVLTSAGINLEGVRKILALEGEIDSLREQLVETLELARQAVEETHRQYRRDLVPLRAQSLPVRRWL